MAAKFKFLAASHHLHPASLTMDEKQQPLPLSQPSPDHHSAAVDEALSSPAAAAEYRSASRALRRSRRFIHLCGFCVVAFLLVGVAAVVLAFTVFRVRNPTLSMNGIFVKHIRLAGDGSPANPLSINATVVADISVRNPNIATLDFGHGVTEFYFEGRAVGEGESPASKVGAKQTETANVTVEVAADRVVVLAGDGSVSAVTGMVRLWSRTEVVGRVRIFGVFRRNVGVTMGCSLSLDSKRAAEVAGSRSCVANVK
ncbi:hypothetical protein AXF42_Ash005380 [Apostasia shenzhenica]|uniref:Late embryogenesis abundant protein LEA-2 subgroup domain-containing protein n=1 Tax=Apostasia shenzhenica TaxID=1088818 RepID=A0A2I0B6S7_9ASPA|nr:hypothetical protein AXF42_Ash005380 [Apostasia shenzhenica]